MNESDDDYYDADDDDYYDDDYYYYYDDDDDDDDKEEEEEARGPIEPKPVSMQKKHPPKKIHKLQLRDPSFRLMQ